MFRKEVKLTSKEDTPFTVQMEVRDYECDLAGGVNNAVYMNYLEHARHCYIKSIGIDFAEYAKQGIGLVVTRLELDFKFSLYSGDVFEVSAQMDRLSKLRVLFSQVIRRKSDGKIIAEAKVTGTAVAASGRPRLPEKIEAILDARVPLAQADS